MSEAIVLKTKPKLKDYFQGSRARRQFFAGEELVAYDVDQLLTFERGYSASKLSHTTSIATLLGCWKRARDSWERVAAALPAGKLRDEMFVELAEREASMDAIAERAEEMIAVKLVNGERDAS
jgi:hypothetical protein